MVSPVGDQVPVADLPLNILPLPDRRHILVATSGYNAHELSLIDLEKKAAVDRQAVHESRFGLAASTRCASGRATHFLRPGSGPGRLGGPTQGSHRSGSARGNAHKGIPCRDRCSHDRAKTELTSKVLVQSPLVAVLVSFLACSGLSIRR